MANVFVFNGQNITVGDTVRVHQKIVEGEKSRNQIFEGIVISIKGEQSQKTFTIRRVSAGGVGVEKILPTNTPDLTKIEVKSHGHVHQAKLYYLRNRIGKSATRVAEKKSVRQAA